jgi:5'-AMP-activated protein kinase regulatory beta subunit
MAVKPTAPKKPAATIQAAKLAAPVAAAPVAAAPAKKAVNLELLAPQAGTVLVTGTFNAWSESATPMKKDKNGSWKTTINLAPGTYEYKFVVDGHWQIDPANSKKTVNPYGSENSFLEVK